MSRYTLFLKRECQTCLLIEPLVRQLGELRIYVQDDAEYLADIGARHDATLEQFFRHYETRRSYSANRSHQKGQSASQQ